MRRFWQQRDQAVVSCSLRAWFDCFAHRVEFFRPDWRRVVQINYSADTAHEFVALFTRSRPHPRTGRRNQIVSLEISVSVGGVNVLIQLGTISERTTRSMSAESGNLKSGTRGSRNRPLTGTN
jgi:hypothetical protein